MNRLTSIFILLFAYELLAPHLNPVLGQNLYDLEHSLKYAKHLSASQKHLLASREYERLAFFYPHVDSISYLLIQSYRRSKQYDKGIDHTEQLFNPVEMPAHFAYQYANLLLLKRSYDKLDQLLDKNNNISSEDKKLLALKTSFLANKWEEAERQINQYDNVKSITRYNLILNKALGFKRKKAGFALGLSLIPGMGKIYTKNTKDGLASLFVIGVTSFLAYRGFSQKGLESFPGWFYGSLGFGFYIGNLYGSYKSAKVYNSKFKKNLNNEIEAIIVDDH